MYCSHRNSNTIWLVISGDTNEALRLTVTMHLGRLGLKLFVLSYRSFLNFGNPLREIPLYTDGVHTNNSFPKALYLPPPPLPVKCWTAGGYQKLT